jgi:hypothetical protein
MLGNYTKFVPQFKNLNMSKYFFFLFVLLLFSCQKETNPDIYIVEAYLYANQPVDHIKIMRRGVAGTYAIDMPVSTAEVIIEDQNRSFTLQESSTNKGWFGYPNNDLSIRAGEKYKLYISANGSQMFSEVLVPFPPSKLQIDKDTICQYDTITDISELKNTFLNLKWHASTEYSFIVLQNLENPANRGAIHSPGDLKYVPYYLLKPINDSSLTIGSDDFEYDGKNSIKIYSVNIEYVNVFQNQSDELSNYPSNITNAIGLFTAFACDSVMVQVKQQ